MGAGESDAGDHSRGAGGADPGQPVFHVTPQSDSTRTSDLPGTRARVPTVPAPGRVPLRRRSAPCGAGRWPCGAAHIILSARLPGQVPVRETGAFDAVR